VDSGPLVTVDGDLPLDLRVDQSARIVVQARLSVGIAQVPAEGVADPIRAPSTTRTQAAFLTKVGLLLDCQTPLIVAVRRPS